LLELYPDCGRKFQQEQGLGDREAEGGQTSVIVP